MGRNETAVDDREPMPGYTAPGVFWGWECLHPRSSPKPHRLPASLWRALRGDAKWDDAPDEVWKWYASRELALAALKTEASPDA